MGWGDHSGSRRADSHSRIRTLTGREIELDVEPTDKVLPNLPPHAVARFPRAQMQKLTYPSAGRTDQGEGRGEGGHPARTAAPHLRREADVSFTKSMVSRGSKMLTVT